MSHRDAFYSATDPVAFTAIQQEVSGDVSYTAASDLSLMGPSGMDATPSVAPKPFV